MDNRSGGLFTHNLWALWESIPRFKQNLIIEKFKTGGYLFDYKSLFEGYEEEGGNEHGDIHLLDIILNITDLELCDLFFEKFKSYHPERYLNYSFWGAKWMDRISKMKNWAMQNNRLEIISRYDLLSPELIYWKDAHFFISNYSKRVYKLYLDGQCDIIRFQDAVDFEIKNHEKIHTSVLQATFTNCKNPVLEQYLIYLEKNKEYKKCISLMNSECFLKWVNDYEKRILRCQNRMDKIEKNGNKSKA